MGFANAGVSRRLDSLEKGKLQLASLSDTDRKPLSCQRAGTGRQAGVSGGLLVDSVEVEHPGTPDGTWASIGTITGDGTSYTGMVTAPIGRRDGIHEVKGS